MTHARESPVTRETSAQYRRRPLIVTLSAFVLTLREKGTRDSVDVPIDAVYEMALKLRARRDRADKLGRRR